VSGFARVCRLYEHDDAVGSAGAAGAVRIAHDVHDVVLSRGAGVTRRSERNDSRAIRRGDKCATRRAGNSLTRGAGNGLTPGDTATSFDTGRAATAAGPGARRPVSGSDASSRHRR